MWGALASFVVWIFGLIVKRPPGPSDDEKLGQAEQALAAERQATAVLESSAGVSAVPVDDSLRRSDPDSRT